MNTLEGERLTGKVTASLSAWTLREIGPLREGGRHGIAQFGGGSPAHATGLQNVNLQPTR